MSHPIAKYLSFNIAGPFWHWLEPSTFPLQAATFVVFW